MLGFGAFIIIFIAVCWRNNTIVYGEPDVKNSMSFNREQHLTVIAYRNKIEDKEAFAEELIQMCKDNSFKTIKFSTDRGYATGIYMNVYLTEKDNLELAYAISVHKSQGSEFDYVYIVIPKRDSHLLSMELLYTAITRAQKKVTIFLQEDIGTLSSLGHIEKSAVRRINSSVFKFAPLPEELLYIQNWYADEKKLATLSKYFVRSKSEVIIANMLVQEEVPFVYEEPLFAPDGTMFLPDFTVKFRGETYYWEHVGRLDLPDYRAHWEIKEKWYEKHFPGKLLTTFEGKDLSTDAMGIIKDHK